MNIDFHYGIIYVVSRLAGMYPADAKTIAHACQYIDDATTTGILVFEEGQTFDRFASAHESFDYHNCLDPENRMVWAPFHFLPGISERHLRNVWSAGRTATSREKWFVDS